MSSKDLITSDLELQMAEGNHNKLSDQKKYHQRFPLKLDLDLIQDLIWGLLFNLPFSEVIKFFGNMDTNARTLFYLSFSPLKPFILNSKVQV